MPALEDGMGSGRATFQRMHTILGRITLAVAGLLALAAAFAVPQGWHAARLWAAGDDPAAIADVALDWALTPQATAQGIRDALQSGDAELAASFVALADARAVPVSDAVRAEVAAANASGVMQVAQHFASGFLSGEPDDAASLAGTVAGDLFVFGDIRDVVRQSGHIARGEEADRVVLALACAGLAITGVTYATLGSAAPARAGVSIIKAAAKTGRISARMGEALMRSVRDVADFRALGAKLGSAWMQPATAIRLTRDAVKVEKLRDLVRVGENLGAVQAKIGTRGAMDALKLADAPKDVEKLAKLAVSKGPSTRAVLKILGRGAIVAGMGLFQLASWMFWALMLAFGFCNALKRAVERLTLSFIHHRKRAALRASLSAA
jgi:hypothetical protein